MRGRSRHSRRRVLNRFRIRTIVALSMYQTQKRNFKSILPFFLFFLCMLFNAGPTLAYNIARFLTLLLEVLCVTTMMVLK